MVSCAVPSCKNDSRRISKKVNDISFHRFPKNSIIAKEWVDAIKRENFEPNIWSYVCSRHFDRSSIVETSKGSRRLALGAVPKLHLNEKLPKKKSKLNPTDEEFPPELKDASLRVKRRIKYLQDIAKRRRLQCNNLYIKVKRLKDKVVELREMLKVLTQNVTVKNESSYAVEIESNKYYGYTDT